MSGPAGVSRRQLLRGHHLVAVAMAIGLLACQHPAEEPSHGGSAGPVTASETAEESASAEGEKAAASPPAGEPASPAESSSSLKSEESSSVDREESSSVKDEDLKQEVDALIEDVKPWDLSGRISMSLRSRARGSQQDEDLYGYLSVDGGDPRHHDFSFHFFGRMTFDLDNDEERSSIFSSLNDTRGKRLDGHLYEAYVDLHRGMVPRSAGIRRIRLGRQRINAGVSYLMDGARIDFAPIPDAFDLAVSIFGGALDFLYESPRTDDWMAGAEIRVHPFRDTRAILRYVHASDRNDWGRTRSLDEDYLSLRVRQRIDEDWRLRGEWNSFDGRTRDLRANVDWSDSDLDLSVSLDYRWQNDIQREFSTPHDPLVVVLGDSFSHHWFNLQVTKLFGERWGIDGGFSARVLADADRVGPFNRDYCRGWISLNSFGWPHDTLSLSLTGEIWDAEEDRSLSVGLEVIWKPVDRFRLSVGEEYARFRSDLFAVEEREDARVFYARMRWTFLEDFRLNARYEYETGDAGDYHSALIGLSWSF